MVALGLLFGALAHPLSDRNFDRAVQVILARSQIMVEYELGLTELTVTTELLQLLDRAEIPVERNAAAQRYLKLLAPLVGRGLILTVNGTEYPLTSVKASFEQADHCRFFLVYEADLPKGLLLTPSLPSAGGGRYRLNLFDTNFLGERGFRRMALRPAPGIALTVSSAPKELNQIPFVPTWEMTPEQEEASQRVEAVFNVAETPTAIIGDSPAPPNSESTTVVEDSQLRAMLTDTRYWWVVLASAFVIGALHALKPGHGKTLVAAYLVGEQGTIGHAVLLGLVVTLTHTGSVMFVALMLQPLAGTRWADEGLLSFWLMLLSGILVAAVGGTMLWRRLKGKEDLLHVHGPGGHSHLPDGTVVWHTEDGGQPIRTGHVHTGQLVALGVSGGLVPCDEAVILLVIAIGAGLLPRALSILLAFSAGLALVLVSIGIMVVKMKGFATQRRSASVWIGRLQYVSATLILLIGLGICASALASPTALRIWTGMRL